MLLTEWVSELKKDIFGVTTNQKKILALYQRIFWKKNKNSYFPFHYPPKHARLPECRAVKEIDMIII